MAVPVAAKFATVGDAPAQKVWDAVPIGADGLGLTVTNCEAHPVVLQVPSART